MRFLKAKVYSSDKWLDAQTELFNLDHVLTIRPNRDGETAKILMGAGLYWDIYIDSVEFVECPNELQKAFQAATKGAK